jgi:hypothetical protein
LSPSWAAFRRGMVSGADISVPSRRAGGDSPAHDDGSPFPTDERTRSLSFKAFHNGKAHAGALLAPVVYMGIRPG